MVVSVQCFVKNNGKMLMLHRTKKKNDVNEGKWIGIGGKLEFGESPEDALIREIKEESGLLLKEYKFVGVVTYAPDKGINYDGEITFFYTSDKFEGDLIECNEGNLDWVDEDKILDLNLWESDYELHKWIKDGRMFSSKITTLDGKLENIDIKFY